MTRWAFHLDASACSGCKACQVACKDKHDLPVGVLWRRVYEVAGGEWERRGGAWLNDVFAYNVSMACNHCERPICLEVCPAAAIGRRDDGVVLIDPDRCMGCRYCEWACPYGALQYDSRVGKMTKCTFCVDHLDAGKAPACVSACPLRVLEFGDREELEARPGPTAVVHPLPDPAYTDPAFVLEPHPRWPGMGGGNGRSDAAPRVANGEEVAAGPSGLQEPSLVAFTLLAQTAVGMVWALVAGRWVPGLASGAELPSGSGWADAAGMGGAGGMSLAALGTAGVLALAALAVSLLHLGRPDNAWRALSNLRSSWLSREILFMGLFTAGVAALVTLELAGAGTGLVEAVAMGTGAAGVGLVYSMVRVYRLRTVPSWDTVRTTVGFFLTALVLGTLTALWVGGVFDFLAPGGERGALAVGVASAALGVAALAAVRSRAWFYARHRRVGV